MKEYPFSVSKVIDATTVDGSLELGFGVQASRRVILGGIKAPLPRLDKRIKNKKKRERARDLGVKARQRLRELLKEGARQPEGLFVGLVDETLQEVKGDIKYIYARDLYNDHPLHQPWIGWKSVSAQLVEEELAKPLKS